MLEYPLLLVFPAAMAFGGVMDLLTLTIPNRVSLFLVATFLAAAPLAGLSAQEFVMHLAAGALILAIGIALFAGGFMGGGDAKLMSVAALWIGLDHLLIYFTQMAVLGGVLALLVLFYRLTPIDGVPVPAWAQRLHDNATGIPYGVAIAGAALWIFPQTPWFAAFAA